MFNFITNILKPKSNNAARAWEIIQSKAGNVVGNGYWLYAAPVHLVLQRDSFSLAAPAPLPLELDEIQALTTALNQYFNQDNRYFFWHDNLWFLRLDANPAIQTSVPQAFINKDINAFMPTGNGAAQWAKFSNEMQMLLFDHHVNVMREANNMQTVNSIWCYGGGQMGDVK